MKVQEIIERLNRDYQPDTELYVEWWDKEIVERFADANLLDEEWTQVVERMEDGERLDQSLIADELTEAAYEVLGERA